MLELTVAAFGSSFALWAWYGGKFCQHSTAYPWATREPLQCIQFMLTRLKRFMRSEVKGIQVITSYIQGKMNIRKYQMYKKLLDSSINFLLGLAAIPPEFPQHSAPIPRCINLSWSASAFFDVQCKHVGTNYNTSWGSFCRMCILVIKAIQYKYDNLGWSFYNTHSNNIWALSLPLLTRKSPATTNFAGLLKLLQKALCLAQVGRSDTWPWTLEKELLQNIDGFKAFNNLSNRFHPIPVPTFTTSLMMVSMAFENQQLENQQLRIFVSKLHWILRLFFVCSLSVGDFNKRIQRYFTTFFKNNATLPKPSKHQICVCWGFWHLKRSMILWEAFTRMTFSLKVPLQRYWPMTFVLSQAYLWQAQNSYSQGVPAFPLLPKLQFLQEELVWKCLWLIWSPKPLNKCRFPKHLGGFVWLLLTFHQPHSEITYGIISGGYKKKN